METTYTVPEDVGTVEVCVNLTQPQIDILEEFVVVDVYDDATSVYIPADTILASQHCSKFCKCMPSWLSILFSS